MSATQLLYVLGHDAPPPSPRDLLGGKGAGLVEIRKLGIPVPPAFTITTDVCRYFYAHRESYPETLREDVEGALAKIEEELGQKLGDPARPLLVSVRSGSRASMPGMMDTILNLGTNVAVVEGLAKASGDRRFAFDAYRRFITMYGDVVLGIDRESLEHPLTEVKRGLGGASMNDALVPADALAKVVEAQKGIVQKATGKPFPEDVREQLWGAITAVFRSWMNRRAVAYRKMNRIPEEWGTAVTVQAMVFGNLGDDCATGVAFSRNPSTGEPGLYGEFLRNAQGEDVVAGIRTPAPIRAAAAHPGQEGETLERSMPPAYEALSTHVRSLEEHFNDMQDVEFTIQHNKVWILQTRNGKRTAQAAVRIAVGLVDQQRLSKEDAVLRVDPASLDQLLHPRVLSPDALAKLGIRSIASGLPASPGAATGKIAFDADEAERLAKTGVDVVLVRRETSPEDIHGMQAARGILTATGGMTSHAAVVARGMGKCCVAGCSTLEIDYARGKLYANGAGEGGGVLELSRGDVITLDGSLGRVYRGEAPVEAASPVKEFETLMSWADQARRMSVRANADTPTAASAARAFGAEGIGLCRTEHMFFADDRVAAVRCMILADDAATRARFVEEIERVQTEDFVGIFRAMDGLPVTVRLLDWPLHEFMPHHTHEMEGLGKMLGISTETVRRKVEALREANPMLGHRGVRLGVTRPDIYRAQVRAIFSAAMRCAREGVRVLPEIMVPVVSMLTEVERMRREITGAYAEVAAREASSLAHLIGTMIELPRACLVAGELATAADFFSFGTNDLTQTTFGISRDDAGPILTSYMSDEVRMLGRDPFASLDRGGVGELVKIACERGRATSAGLKLGVCGEHGGDPESIDFCEGVGLDYVSCSPFRVPIARLAAAQAALRARGRAGSTHSRAS